MDPSPPEEAPPSPLRAIFSGTTTSTAVQFIRYIFVGGGAFLVDFGTMALLHHGVGIHYLTASAVGFGLGLVVNYLISVAWVFETRKLRRRWLEFFAYSLIGVVGLGLNQLVIWAITEHILAVPLASKLAAAAIVLVWNFSARKFLLF
jgi:putative flippase GtrA